MLIEFGFSGIALLSLGFLFIGAGKNGRVLLFFAVWGMIISLVSATGFWENTQAMPPRILLAVVPAILLSVYFYRKLDTAKLNLNGLLAIHLVRIPVEIALFALFEQGKVPKLMTYEGWNLDILMGISAGLILGYQLLRKKQLNRTFMITWNWIGLSMLTTIVVLATLSAPTVFQQLAFDQPNTAIFVFPFILLPGLIVPIVFFSHLLALKLLRKSEVE